MNRYESTIVLTPILSEEDVKKKLNHYKDFLSENGATNIKDEHWGLKKLAYSIDKKSTGFYHIFDFEAQGDLIGKIELQLKRDESVLRFLTVKLDKYAVEWADKRLGKKSEKVSEE